MLVYDCRDGMKGAFSQRLLKLTGWGLLKEKNRGAVWQGSWRGSHYRARRRVWFQTCPFCGDLGKWKWKCEVGLGI